jgi:hypothetical protein
VFYLVNKEHKQLPRYDMICKNEHETIDLVKGVNDPFPPCPTCGEATSILWTQTAAIIGDDIPGGIEMRHGICNPDGTPKRYYSKTEIKRAANEKGLSWGDDTPGKPYKVSWNGRRADGSHAKR